MINSDDNKAGLCRVTYTTETRGCYFITVRFDGEHIVGSPFKAYIQGRFTVHPIVSQRHKTRLLLSVD